VKNKMTKLLSLSSENMSAQIRTQNFAFWNLWTNLD